MILKTADQAELSSALYLLFAQAERHSSLRHPTSSSIWLNPGMETLLRVAGEEMLCTKPRSAGILFRLYVHRTSGAPCVTPSNLYGLHQPARRYVSSDGLGSSPISSRKQVTIANDDGRVQWQHLSTREKAARTTQQTLNFGLILAGFVGTVWILVSFT